jgi:hypothetical protein
MESRTLRISENSFIPQRIFQNVRYIYIDNKVIKNLLFSESWSQDLSLRREVWFETSRIESHTFRPLSTFQPLSTFRPLRSFQAHSLRFLSHARPSTRVLQQIQFPYFIQLPCSTNSLISSNSRHGKLPLLGLAKTHSYLSESSKM